ncbi:MAG: replication and repair protein RecF protein [Candidatus Saccharibacteria bacterium]|jgi:DNA replication and repair protein RecF|nr:replication and repair protein RecF protein [Candidatus Saccharibacteria bacterium]
MKLVGLELTNFRSYERASFELHPDVTLVVGPNASGKTNLLESLYVLASTKSFRAKDRDLVRHEQDHFRIVAHNPDTEYALGLSIAGGPMEKKITHDGVKQTLVGHVGQIQVTLFEPTDLDLVAGPPEGRRRYLDFVLCQTDRSYLKTLQQYKRVLKQRNALLDGFDIEAIRQQIFTWDLKLTELAAEVFERRQELLQTLNGSIPLLYSEIAGESLSVALEYIPSVSGDYAANFMDALVRNLTRDLGAGFTTIGPHREDFKVKFKNNDITAVASRGEVRTVVLAMKLAELGYAEQRTGVRPILLLDDVFSELDRDRRSFLLGRLEGHQTIITTTDADAITREFTTPHAIISTETPAHA